MSEELIRPVKCHLCNQPMFYSSDPKWENEIRVTIEVNSYEHVVIYLHCRCWNLAIRRFNEKDSLTAPETF